jgi:hypothetical protein
MVVGVLVDEVVVNEEFSVRVLDTVDKDVKEDCSPDWEVDDIEDAADVTDERVLCGTVRADIKLPAVDGRTEIDSNADDSVLLTLLDTAAEEVVWAVAVAVTVTETEATKDELVLEDWAVLTADDPAFETTLVWLDVTDVLKDLEFDKDDEIWAKVVMDSCVVVDPNKLTEDLVPEVDAREDGCDTVWVETEPEIIEEEVSNAVDVCVSVWELVLISEAVMVELVVASEGIIVELVVTSGPFMAELMLDDAVVDSVPDDEEVDSWELMLAGGSDEVETAPKDSEEDRTIDWELVEAE